MNQSPFYRLAQSYLGNVPTQRKKKKCPSRSLENKRRWKHRVVFTRATLGKSNQYTRVQHTATTNQAWNSVNPFSLAFSPHLFYFSRDIFSHRASIYFIVRDTPEDKGRRSRGKTSDEYIRGRKVLTRARARMRARSFIGFSVRTTVLFFYSQWRGGSDKSLRRREW